MKVIKYLLVMVLCLLSMHTSYAGQQSIETEEIRLCLRNTDRVFWNDISIYYDQDKVYSASSERMLVYPIDEDKSESLSFRGISTYSTETIIEKLKNDRRYKYISDNLMTIDGEECRHLDLIDLHKKLHLHAYIFHSMLVLYTGQNENHQEYEKLLLTINFHSDVFDAQQICAPVDKTIKCKIVGNAFYVVPVNEDISGYLAVRTLDGKTKQDIADEISEMGNYVLAGENSDDSICGWNYMKYVDKLTHNVVLAWTNASHIVIYFGPEENIGYFRKNICEMKE